MTGSLAIAGLGPGSTDWMTPEVAQALGRATDVLGYHAYVARVALPSGCRTHTSDNGDELERARSALALAASGLRVVVVSGGDPGVFAMAAAVFEALERGDPEWRKLEIQVLPGVTAMLAAAARLGAPLGGDFCAINLSNNLKPWSIVESRLAAAAAADFVIALYNPASRARPHQIWTAFDVLRRHRTPDNVVVLARSVGREKEAFKVATLEHVDIGSIDMQTLVIVGASSTRRIDRPNTIPWVYTPRSVEAPSNA